MIQALLVRSDGSGGLATGMTYDRDSETLVIIGTTFAQNFWGIQQQNLEDKGECFVAVGDIAVIDKPEFLKATFPKPAYCFGSIQLSHEVLVNDGLGDRQAVTYYGVNIEESTPVGFLDTMLYTARFVDPSSFELPYDVPSGQLPVTMASSEMEPTSVYVGLHNPSELFGRSGETPSEILTGLLSDWWSSTSPSQMKQIINSSFIPDPLVPQLRKLDVVTGALLFGVFLEPNEPSATALISGILFPTVTSSDTRVPPVVVVGSTNGPDTKGSLFGFTGAQGGTGSSGGFDGYVLFLKPDSGAISPDPVTGKWALRVASTGDNTDDFIEGACLSPDHQYLYVVGTTEGIIEGIHSGGAFVIKYDLSASEIIWQYQVSGDKVQGLLCTADDDALYLGGVTESDLWESPGKNSPTQSPDAFVAKIIDGVAQWIRPLDTTNQEQGDLRREWITGMEITNQGKILVLLNSMNLAAGASDVFLVDLDPEKGDNDLYAALNYAGTGIPTFKSLSKKERVQKEVAIAAIVTPVVIAVCLFGFTCWWQYRSTKERIPKSELDNHMATEAAKEEATNQDAGSNEIL
jgi:hypothetical protein